MTGPVKARALGQHISLVAGLDRTAPESSEYDPDEPREPHESHDMILFDRWAECALCGARDHWPAITLPCAGQRPGRDSRLTVDYAVGVFLADLEAFSDWWKDKNLGTRPTMADWWAEFFEWTRNGGGRR